MSGRLASGLNVLGGGHDDVFWDREVGQFPPHGHGHVPLVLDLRQDDKQVEITLQRRLLPEEKLEAALIMGDRSSVERLVREEESGVAEERKQYLYEEAPRRNPDLVDRLQRLYKGHCQVCRWDPVDEYGESLCEGHHIRWLSRGGDDALDNLMLVCPNHHRAIHRCDAPLDWDDMAYDFGDHREAVAVDQHLEGAVG